MRIKAVLPPGAAQVSEALKLSPGVISGNHLFVTGMTGSAADGTMPADAAEQFRNAFDKIGAVLAEAGLTHAEIVEMTSYHIGIQDHFDLFSEIRAQYVTTPYPAWTAVEVAGFRRAGALVEIRVIAAYPIAGNRHHQPDR